MFNRVTQGGQKPSPAEPTTTTATMEKFSVEVKEVLSRIVEVEAPDANEAERIVRKQYFDCDIVLTEDDYQEVEINTLPRSINRVAADPAIRRHIKTREI